MDRFDKIEDLEKSTDQSNDDLHRNFAPTDQPLEGHGKVEDSMMSDDRGRALTLRTEDGNKEQLDKALQQDTHLTYHQTRIRVFDGSKEIGQANVDFTIEKDFNTQTDHYEQIADVRAKLNNLEVTPNYRNHDVGSQIVSRAEEIARRAGAREIYGDMARPELRAFYQQNGYDFRTGSGGGTEFYKSYYFK